MGIVTVLGVTALGTAAWHVPVRGRSVRDRVSPGPRTSLRVGVRLLSATERRVGPADLDSVLREAPVAVESLVVTQVPAAVRGEFVHVYRSFADKLGVGDRDWTHVLLSSTATASTTNRRLLLEHVIHRLGCLGVRSKPLSSVELGLPGMRLGALRRRGDSPHLHRAAVWTGPNDGVVVDPVPTQVLGICADGSAFSVPMAVTSRVTVSGGPDDAVRLLSPALATGVRVGISTRRPGRFTVLRQRGAEIHEPGQDDGFDVILDDLGERNSRHAAPPPAGGVQLVDPRFPAPAPRPHTGFITVTAGNHTWTAVHDTGETTVFRPG